MRFGLFWNCCWCSWLLAFVSRPSARMSRTINIEINASLQDSWLIHCILNFKDELHREFLRSGHATIADPAAVDRALSPLRINIASKRSLASVSAIISKALKRYEVADAVRVSRAS